MSRLGKKPIDLPKDVTVEVASDKISVKGPKGSLEIATNPRVKVEVKDNQIITSVKDNDDQEMKSHWGLMVSLINNMVIGVTEGYEKKLEINGVGYRAQMKGKDLELNVGFSHKINFKTPAGVEISVDKNIITISGIDKQLVGQVAAEIRAYRKPEPYKGKGIKYIDEEIRRKAGKVGKATTAV